jgi:hypothetical protein
MSIVKNKLWRNLAVTVKKKMGGGVAAAGGGFGAHETPAAIGGSARQQLRVAKTALNQAA